MLHYVTLIDVCRVTSHNIWQDPAYTSHSNICLFFVYRTSPTCSLHHYHFHVCADSNGGFTETGGALNPFMNPSQLLWKVREWVKQARQVKEISLNLIHDLHITVCICVTSDAYAPSGGKDVKNVCLSFRSFALKESSIRHYCRIAGRRVGSSSHIHVAYIATRRERYYHKILFGVTEFALPLSSQLAHLCVAIIVNDPYMVNGGKSI